MVAMMTLLRQFMAQRFLFMMNFNWCRLYQQKTPARLLWKQTRNQDTKKAPLTCTLAFFILVIATKTHENDFGPGFYTFNKSEYTFAYCSFSGAIMMFKNPIFRDPKSPKEPVVHRCIELTNTFG